MKQATHRDIVEDVGKSVLQHGKLNDRVYIMKVDPDDVVHVLETVDRLIETHKYGKVFAKVPASVTEAFVQYHYAVEALIPRYYRNGEDCLFMSRFFDVGRMDAADPAHPGAVADTDISPPPTLPGGYTLRACGPADAGAMFERLAAEGRASTVLESRYECDGDTAMLLTGRYHLKQRAHSADA